MDKAGIYYFYFILVFSLLSRMIVNYKKQDLLLEQNKTRLVQLEHTSIKEDIKLKKEDKEDYLNNTDFKESFEQELNILRRKKGLLPSNSKDIGDLICLHDFEFLNTFTHLLNKKSINVDNFNTQKEAYLKSKPKKYNFKLVKESFQIKINKGA